MLETMHRLHAHMAWADRRVLELLRAGHGSREPAVLRLLGHVLAAERVWLMRLRGEETAAEPIWPEHTLPDLETIAARNAREYRSFLDRLDRDALTTEIAYSNSQGVQFRTTVADVLTHVFMHGSYHRGQIAAAIRAAGGQPVNTDFITWVRELQPA